MRVCGRAGVKLEYGCVSPAFILAISCSRSWIWNLTSISCSRSGIQIHDLLHDFAGMKAGVQVAKWRSHLRMKVVVIPETVRCPISTSPVQLSKATLFCAEEMGQCCTGASRDRASDNRIPKARLILRQGDGGSCAGASRHRAQTVSGIIIACIRRRFGTCCVLGYTMRSHRAGASAG